jgi:hypothetical protein
MRRNWVYLLILVAASAVMGAGTALALAASSGAVAPKDSFRGRVTAGSGRFRSDNGQTSIKVHVAQSNTGTRLVTLIIGYRRCATAARCLQLSGTLRGTLTQSHSIPDAGASFALSASGKVRPLGHVSAIGQVHGTGFVMHGRETMTVQLADSRGQVTVQAQSPQVPAFTSP